MAEKLKPYGQKVTITKGRLKGETGTTEGYRVSANYETMLWVRRDNPKAMDRVIQITTRWLKPTGG